MTYTMNPVLATNIQQLGIQVSTTAPMTIWIDDVTITLAAAPTPTSTTVTDITSNINGSCVSGDTTSSSDSYSEQITGPNNTSYNYGAGAPDIVYSFNLTQPTNLFINLCGATFDSVLYLRTNPSDPNTTLALDDDSDYCQKTNPPGSSSFVTGILQPGTYYVIVDGYGPGDYGPFTLCLNTFNPTCSLTPIAAPIALGSPSGTTDLGTVSVDAVGTGHVDWDFEYNNSWTFTPAAAGSYVISLDCFDDGNDSGKARVAYDLFDSGSNQVASSNGNTPLDQLTVDLTQQQYTVVVYAFSQGAPSGDYRLVIQAPAQATNTPTVTETPVPGITDITSSIDGTCVSGDTTGLGDTYSETIGADTYGQGAPDTAYLINLTQPTNLYISLCGANWGSVLYMRTNPADPSTTINFDQTSASCGDGSPSFVTGVLQPGIYYIIVDGTGAGNFGAYNLCLSTYSPTCSLTPVAAPIPLGSPSGSTDLGTVTVDAVGTGHVDVNFEETNTWTFTPGTAGSYVISLDCFDDTTNKVQAQYTLWDAGNNLIATSNGNDPLDQLAVDLTVQQYTVVVIDNWLDEPSGDYRLVITAPAATATPTVTSTSTPNKPPVLTVTPPLTFTPTVPAGACTQLVNSFETFTGTNPYTTENGSLAPDSDNPTLSQTTTGATDGINALDIDITVNNNSNQLVDWSGFTQSDFTNVTQILMDVTVDSNLIQTGAGAYNQLALIANPSSWTPITGNIDITAGSQTVTFTVSGAPAQVTDLLLIFNTDGSGTGNLYIDNVRFVYSVCPPTPTPTPIITNNSIWSFNASCPVGVAVDNNGNVYTSDPCYGLIHVYDFNGDYLYDITPPNPNPWGNSPTPLGLAVDNNGNLFAADYGNGNGEIMEFNTSTGALENMFWGSNNNSVTYIQAPYDVKLDGSGNLYVADYQGGYVAKIDPTTDTLTTLCSNTGGLVPMGVAVDSTGTNVYATDPVNDWVYQYDTATLTVQNSFNGSSWPTPLTAPTGIGVDQAGNLIICDFGNAVLDNTDTSGNFLQAVSPGGFQYPYYIAFDPSGSLYVTMNQWQIIGVIQNGVGNFQ